MSKPESFYESIKHLTIISEIFALNSVNYKNGIYEKSKTQKVLTVFYATAFLSSLYYCNVTSVKIVKNEEMSEIYETIFILCEIKILLRFVAIYFYRNFHGEKERDLYRSMDSLDSVLKSLGKTKELQETNRKIFRETSIILGISFLVAFFSEFYVYVFAVSAINPAVFIVRALPATVGSLSKCYYFLWISVLKNRFSLINSSLDEIRRRSKLRRKTFFSLYKFEKEISLIMELHRELTKLSRLLNTFFELELIFHFLIIFNVSFSNGYYFMYILTKHKQNKFIHGLTVFKNYVFVGFDYYVVFLASTKLCKQAGDALKLMNVMQIDPYDEISHRMVVAYIFELKENKLDITVYRLFNINYSTLFAMYTNISNYVFVLLQLESGKFEVTE